ncbi:MAG TPA: RagB/SusD family nutrient uptake outer membrane protein [Bacteroidales bacterium]|nr:RagB/SusD family nutrient uptake outer membrane protein [Bacteroidales bacterium]
MKTKIKRINIIVFASTLLLFACSESFLDTEPRGVLSVDNFYKTDAEVASGTLVCYDLVQDQQFGIWQGSYLVRMVLGDEAITGGGGRGDQPGYEELNEFNFGPNNPFMGQVYAGCFRIINRCNTLLTYVTDDSPAKKINIAEAKCLRAFANFELVTLYGGNASLVLNLLGPSEYQQGPGGEANFWTAIEADLTEAAADLPKKSEYSASDKYRVSKGFAQALLGKAYLYQGKYAEAAAIFETVITSTEYSLVPATTVASMEDIFKIPQEFGRESLFEISFSPSTSRDWGNFDWGNNRRNENCITWELMGARGEYFSDLAPIGMSGGWGFGYPIPRVDALFLSEGPADNIRRQATLMSSAELTAAGVTVGNASGTLAYGYAGYIRVKYASWLSERGAPVGELNYGTNLRYMRYADVLLMAAEANILKTSPDNTKARGYINQVRTRAGLGIAPEADANLFDRIVKERQMELAFEGWRYMDLMRWIKNGKMTEAQVQTLMDACIPYLPKGAGDVPYRKAWQVKYKLLAIPEQEILTNPNAVQNDGY